MKTTSDTRRSFAVLLAGAVALASGVACTARVGEDVTTGAIETALTSVGPDGAAYSLPAGTSLTIAGPAPSAASVTVPVDGPGATAAFTLPAGTYLATLSSVTSLVRAGATGAAAAVPATLTDAQPYAVTITSGHTTPLTFHFTLAEFGTVTVGTSSGSGSGSGSSSGSSSGGSSSSSGSGSSSGGGAACVHSVCVTGAKLSRSCSTCATHVCAADPYCCNTKWDSVCAGEVPTYCAAGTCP